MMPTREIVEFTAADWDRRIELDEHVQSAKWLAVTALTEIAQSGLFGITHNTFEDYLRDVVGIAESTYRSWKSAWQASELAASCDATLKNPHAARALCETEQAARETVCRMAAAKAGGRNLTARDIRNAANALMESMDNVAAGDDVQDLPELAQQSQHEAGMRTSADIDKAQGWCAAYQWRVGDGEMIKGVTPDQVIEIKWRVIE